MRPYRSRPLVGFLVLAALTPLLAAFVVRSGASAPTRAVHTAPPQVNEDYETMMDVLTHPRCMNCHPAADHPLVGDPGNVRPHDFGVQRGPDDRGLPALRCSGCHQAENNALAGVPGAPEWSLAPRSMAWQGKSRAEIARSILDPDRNGGRTLSEVVDHLTHHELVLWAWEPGVRNDGTPREPPPVDVDTYIAAVQGWAAAGAPIPEQAGGTP